MNEINQRLLELYEEVEDYEVRKAGCVNKINELKKEIKELKEQRLNLARGGYIGREENN